MSRHIKPKAQSLVEYSVILVIVAAAVMSMQLYMKRGLQAAVKIQADRLGPQQMPLATSNRYQMSMNSFTSETKSDTARKQVSAGGQTITDASSATMSGTTNSISTMDYTYP